MTTDELASELFDLIVIRGRGARPGGILGDSFADTPEWNQDLWRLKAVEFASLNSFKLDQ